MSIKIAFSTEEKKEHKKGLKKAKKQNKKAIFLPQGKSYAFEKMISEITRSQEKKEVREKQKEETLKIKEMLKYGMKIAEIAQSMGKDYMQIYNVYRKFKK